MQEGHGVKMRKVAEKSNGLPLGANSLACAAKHTGDP